MSPNELLSMEIGPITLTIDEAVTALAMLDAAIPGFDPIPEFQIPGQSVRDKIYLAIPEDLRRLLPQEAIR